MGRTAFLFLGFLLCLSILIPELLADPIVTSTEALSQITPAPLLIQRQASSTAANFIGYSVQTVQAGTTSWGSNVCRNNLTYATSATSYWACCAPDQDCFFYTSCSGRVAVGRGLTATCSELCTTQVLFPFPALTTSSLVYAYCTGDNNPALTAFRDTTGVLSSSTASSSSSSTSSLSSQTNVSSGNGSSSSTGPIVGGVIGGLFVIGIIIGVFFFLRKKNQKLNERRSQTASIQSPPRHSSQQGSMTLVSAAGPGSIRPSIQHTTSDGYANSLNSGYSGSRSNIAGGAASSIAPSSHRLPYGARRSGNQPHLSTSPPAIGREQPFPYFAGHDSKGAQSPPAVARSVQSGGHNHSGAATPAGEEPPQYSVYAPDSHGQGVQGRNYVHSDHASPVIELDAQPPLAEIPGDEPMQTARGREEALRLSRQMDLEETQGGGTTRQPAQRSQQQQQPERGSYIPDLGHQAGPVETMNRER